MNRMHNRSILNNTRRIIEVGARGLWNIKFWALLVSAVLIGTLYLSPLISSLTNSVIIENSGQISIPFITAASGYWQDVQAAVDSVVALGGIGNVYIPEGTFNFVNVNENWTGARVVIPAGVNLFGAPTERTSGLPYDGVGQNPNDQVVEWKTILVMPWDAPGAVRDVSAVTWFKINGRGDPDKPSRFSDIKLVGYRSIDPESIEMFGAIEVDTVIDFRIDHCYFEHTADGISVYSGFEKPTLIRGVIDHCFLVNKYGFPAPYGEHTCGYGVHVLIDWHYNVWNSIDKVLGHYDNNTAVIEDCYFEKWRHNICTNNGGHIIFRHNTIQYDFGYGTLDQHEKRTETSGRALEVYNNRFLDPVAPPPEMDAIWWRGGSGVAFNNIVAGYNIFAYLVEHDQGEYNPDDIWVWNNTLNGATDIGVYSPNNLIKEGENYYRHAPHTFVYEPYPYPHPLVLLEMP